MNWVSKLMEYQKVLNEESMDVLGKQSPFEVFYSRASNALSQIRCPFSGRTRGTPKKRFVVDGMIIKRNVKFGKYKITHESPTTEKSCCDWVSVKDMTSATAVEEKCKRAAARRQMSLSKIQKEQKAKKAAHREKYYIAMMPEDLHQLFSEQDYDVTYNPPGDGNCLFSVLAHLLQTIGIFHSRNLCREK